MLGSFVRPAILYKNEQKFAIKKEANIVPKVEQFYLPLTAPEQQLSDANPDDKADKPADVSFFITMSKGVEIKIDLKKREAETLTCGWLLSEAIRRSSEIVSDDFKNVLYLQTVKKNFALDYWLTLLDRSLETFQGDVSLEPFIAERRISKGGDIENYIILKKIGDGASANVYLTRKKSNGRFFAVKVFDKDIISRKNLKEKVLNEKEVMETLDCQYLVSLKESFQNDKFLFMAMDYCPGGELFFHLRKKGRFSESEAGFFFREVLISLDYLHKRNIVFRDLKPENILLDIDGHIKLIDLGISKKLRPKERTNSFCGSLDYIPPEMVKKKSYGLSADIYSLGVLLYELIAGYPPYSSKSSETTLELIEKQKLTFPQFFSRDLIDLIRKLMKSDPSKRLGAKEGCLKIFEHPWCVRLKNLCEKPPVVLDFANDYHFTFEDDKLDNFTSTRKPNYLNMDFPNFNYKKPNPNYYSLEDIVIREEFIKEPRNIQRLYSVSAHLGDDETFNSEIISNFEKSAEKQNNEYFVEKKGRNEMPKSSGKGISMMGRVLQAFRKSNSLKK